MIEDWGGAFLATIIYRMPDASGFAMDKMKADIAQSAEKR
jgi:hypothetical protein